MWLNTDPRCRRGRETELDAARTPLSMVWKAGLAAGARVKTDIVDARTME